MNCLCYVDLNMVRAGRADHPGKWKWCGYDELTGMRQRYRIIDTDRLKESLNFTDEIELRESYTELIKQRMKENRLKRERHWTDALAVGTERFVEGFQGAYPGRLGYNVNHVSNDADVWTIQEETPPYSTKEASQNAAKTSRAPLYAYNNI